jgi:phosphoribosylformylglycinamidine synthase
MQKNKITFFLGNETYSQFRKTALEDQIKNKNSEIISIDVNDIYAIESNTLLPESAKQNLQKILNSDKGSLTNLKIGNNLFIGPRVGTISPWSSRATDIIKNCGINILRAEKLSLFHKGKYKKPFHS